jgi:hypothetical protein
METSFLIPLLLLLISAGIGLQLRQGTKQSEKTDQVKDSLADQGRTLARVDATLGSTVTRVDELHRWKSDFQERENAELRRRVEQLKRERESDT